MIFLVFVKICLKIGALLSAFGSLSIIALGGFATKSNIGVSAINSAPSMDTGTLILVLAFGAFACWIISALIKFAIDGM